MQFSNTKSSVGDERIYRLRLLGTGAADPTVEIGQGVKVTHQATGVYRVTFSGGPGTFINIGGYAFGGATPANVKGQTITRSTFTVPTTTAPGFIDISVWSSAFAADDLQTTEYLDISLIFSEN